MTALSGSQRVSQLTVSAVGWATATRQSQLALALTTIAQFIIGNVILAERERQREEERERGRVRDRLQVLTIKNMCVCVCVLLVHTVAYPETVLCLSPQLSPSAVTHKHRSVYLQCFATLALMCGSTKCVAATGAAAGSAAAADCKLHATK